MAVALPGTGDVGHAAIPDTRVDFRREIDGRESRMVRDVRVFGGMFMRIGTSACAL